MTWFYYLDSFLILVVVNTLKVGRISHLSCKPELSARVDVDFQFLINIHEGLNLNLLAARNCA